MNIVIVSTGYPNSIKSEFAFVKELVVQWAKQGHNCTVIAPFSITKYRRKYKYCIEEIVEGGTSIKVIRPNMMTFSSTKILGFSPTRKSYSYVINRTLESLSSKPDVIYCHFWANGIYSYKFAKKYSIPLFVATGESEIARLTPQAPKGFAEYVTGVICVSSKNKEESISLGLTTAKKCHVFPNSINSSVFRKLDKIECRTNLGLPIDAFIIAYLGNYTERKGASRVVEALNLIEWNPVHALFIGWGDYKPNYKNILFEGRLFHEQVPEYLNAADVFVLPTRKEGCCNAVIEAMACGLPIISSNRSFNWDVLNSDNSIMIEPDDIQEIKRAIETLRDDIHLRARLSEGSLHTANTLTIDQRATNIMDFMKERLLNHYHSLEDPPLTDSCFSLFNVCFNKFSHLFELRRKNVSDKEVFLTFDDGPEEGITDYVLDELRKYNAKATFFCKGMNAELHPELLERIKSEGHSIGNHTYSHLHGFRTSKHTYIHDVERANSVLRTHLFRPPWGALTLGQFLKSVFKYRIVYWSLDSKDFSHKELYFDKELQRLQSNTKSGDVVLFHFCKEHEHNTRKLLPRYLKWLYDNGYTSKGID